jgi:hypothetical protein
VSRKIFFLQERSSPITRSTRRHRCELVVKGVYLLSSSVGAKMIASRVKPCVYWLRAFDLFPLLEQLEEARAFGESLKVEESKRFAIRGAAPAGRLIPDKKGREPA